MTNLRRIKPGIILEWGINLLLWIGWIVMINAGTENGIGYFRQPHHSLLCPLINGAVFNAITFGVVGFFLVPRCLAKRRFSAFFLGLLALSIGVLLFKTAAEKIIIALSMPDLNKVHIGMLALENVYILVAFILIGLLYRFARDWFVTGHDAVETSEHQWRDENMVIQVKSGSKVHRVSVDNVLYVKSEGNYVVFVDTQKRVMAHMTMAEVLGRLPGNRFVRIHRSYIAAIDHIDTIETNRVKIRDAYLPIGGKYRRDFMQKMKLALPDSDNRSGELAS